MAGFIKQSVLVTNQFLQPVLPTTAIELLTNYLSHRFSGVGATAEQKPTVAVCFDTSGSGKTTTVAEAAIQAGAHRIIISPNLSPILTQVLDRCRELRHTLEKSGNRIARMDIEEAFEGKFKSALETMFERILSLVERFQDTPSFHVMDDGTYSSPPASRVNINQTTFDSICGALNGRRLIIHVDDVQFFFNGMIPSLDSKNSFHINSSEIMALAVRCFSKCIAPFARKKDVVWIFTGTRPTLVSEITLTSGLDAFDFSRGMSDFDTAKVGTILRHYFNLPTDLPSSLTVLYERLVGPPRNIAFFLVSSTEREFKLESVEDLVSSWDRIESSAIRHMRSKIEASFIGDISLTARNICLVHATCLIGKNTDYIDVPSVSRHFVSLVEAGLLRIHQLNVDEGWRIFAPNRFLVKILEKYVRWFKWDNLATLKSLITSSGTTGTLKGKVFEFLFALELCNSPTSRLWTYFSETLKISQIPSWNPLIVNTPSVAECSNPGTIFVMVDPARDKSKTDVIFFATKTGTTEIVRVLVQLTLANCGMDKINKSYDAMLQTVPPFVVGPGEIVLDYRFFIGPKCTLAALGGSNFYRQNYADNRCYTFLKSSDLASKFELSIDVLCNPLATEAAINSLVRKAETFGDLGLANQLENCAISPANSNKRRATETDTVDVNVKPLTISLKFGEKYVVKALRVLEGKTIGSLMAGRGLVMEGCILKTTDHADARLIATLIADGSTQQIEFDSALHSIFPAGGHFEIELEKEEALDWIRLL
ncbi:hypothetical protein BDR26DRAFT_872119 [Obelidium mucronatum]|nr:hypothetical protein BDR26DRAFT_872119 [Obelidium mucronatum]